MDEIDNSNAVSQAQKGTSNTTVIMLIILALLVTIIGTWLVLNSINPVDSPSQKTVESDSGKVTIAILGDTRTHSDDAGQITLNIDSASSPQ